MHLNETDVKYEPLYYAVFFIFELITFLRVIAS